MYLEVKTALEQIFTLSQSWKPETHLTSGSFSDSLSRASRGYVMYYVLKLMQK